MKENPQNSSLVLLMGILSILLTFVIGVGIIPGIIGLYNARKAALKSGKLRTGRILCIIGVVLSTTVILGIGYEISKKGFDGYVNESEKVFDDFFSK